MHILLDTSVLSEARRQEPVQEVQRFLRSLPDESIAIPAPVVFELERGGQMLRTSRPDRAEPLLSWLGGLLATNVFIPPMGAEIFRLIATMATVPALRRFWRDDRTTGELRFGCDPAIAAVAIHYQMPVATRDVNDFMLIHRHFRIPGVYEPFHRRWHVDPSEEWQFVLDDERSNCLIF
ncbi:hypothetical protein [Rhizobium sp. BK376]|uniref:type II toxin-antitoxin system VapC family toxin n=1 Tax=Rhizobium sp. BK376 TaxID=2512149 RepID=UPI001052ABC4|nr:hypothetical protein [Rhizobium sp. BK376]TCR85309.1 hypothetical protein EV561_10780 [Rhizobium sp. BK376]